MKDYSEIENFNMAAIDAVREGYKDVVISGNTVEVVYFYKGRTLKAKAEISVDGEQIRYVGILSVEQVKE